MAQDTAKDPVCGMELSTMDARFKSAHNGETYYFCSQSCKDKFDSDPLKYAKDKTAAA